MAEKIGEKELVKIQFYHSDIGYENLWASELDKNRYRLESIPFFIYGVSLHDVIRASSDAAGRLQFVKVVKPSPNRTLRARSDEFVRKAARRNRVIAGLEQLGCAVEVLRSRLMAINVPPSADLKAVTDYLTNDAKVIWEYGNPQGQNK